MERGEDLAKLRGRSDLARAGQVTLQSGQGGLQLLVAFPRAGVDRGDESRDECRILLPIASAPTDARERFSADFDDLAAGSLDFLKGLENFRVLFQGDFHGPIEAPVFVKKAVCGRGVSRLGQTTQGGERGDACR